MTMTDTVNGLRAEVRNVERLREHAWEHRNEEGHDYQAAAAHVVEVRRQLAEAIAVEQGKGDFVVTLTVRDLDVTSGAEAEAEALRRILIGGPGLTINTELPALRPIVVVHGPGDPPGVTYVACAVCGAEADEWRYEEDEWSSRSSIVPTLTDDGETVTVTVGSSTDYGSDGGNDDPGLVCGTCHYRIDAEVTDWT